jgi:putative FmdB family regulatory protein
MPLYEYVCDECGYSFERLQSFKDDPVRLCPNCNSPVRRVISPVGVIFKGSGWYITDSQRQISGRGKGTAGTSRSTDTSRGDGDAATGKGDSPGPATGAADPKAPKTEPTG